MSRSIGAFGGDKKRVMIFGESAGGGSVSCHLTNKQSWGLFSSAAIESGSMTSWMAQPMNVAEDKFQLLASQSGCAGSNADILNCLLDKTTEEIFQLSHSISTVSTYCTYSPTADGVEMSTHPWVSLADGVVADVPILHGTNSDEAAIFAPLPKDANLNQAERYWKRKEFYPNYQYSDTDIAALEELYLKQTYRNVSHVSQEFWAAAHSTGDSHFACGARYMNKMLAQMQVAGTHTSSLYHYHFQHPRHHMRFVSHFSEVPYVFNWGYVGFRQYPEDQDMADVMTAYWGNFIIDHNPSSHSVSYTSQLPTWEPYSAASENTILLPSKEGITMGTSLKRDECDFMIPILDKTLRAAFA
jgi:carboxylesterase type B